MTPDVLNPSEQSEMLTTGALNTIASQHHRAGRYDEAATVAEKARRQAQEAGEQHEEAVALNTLGGIAIRRGDYYEAEEQLQRALHIAITLDDKHSIANITANIGNIYANLSKYPRAIEYFHRAMEIDEELEHKSGIASNFGNLGWVYNLLSDYPRSLEYHHKALAICEEIGDHRGIASNIGSIGSVFVVLSDYSRALGYLQQALALSEELDDLHSIAAHTSNIARVYLELKDYPRALEYSQKSLVIFEELGNSRNVADMTGNIGLIYMRNEDYALALEYYQKALPLQEETGSASSILHNIGNAGEAYLLVKDFPRAADFLHRALELSMSAGMKNECAEIHNNIGSLYANEEYEGYNLAKAEEHLLASIALSEELDNKKYDAHKTLAELYEKKELWSQFAYHHKKHYALKEEVQSDEARKQAENLEYRRLISEQEKRRLVEQATAFARIEEQERLLHKVLPPSIAARMLAGETRIADYFSSVSILFADIVGFTPLIARMPPKAVIDLLSFVFGEFDSIMERYGCERIKTIGDGYMAVAGAPIFCEDHAERIARAALAMQEDIQLPDEIRKYLPKDISFGVRIGLHTGAAVGGVIGSKRFMYDIYSDAVNIAARMESYGEPNQIHVSEEFAWHIKTRQSMAGAEKEFQFEPREEIEIKGKGWMQTHFLERAPDIKN